MSMPCWSMSAKRKSRSQHSGGIGRCTTLPAISMVVEPSACAISFGATRADSPPSRRIVSCGSIWAWMSTVQLRSIVGTIPALHDVSLMQAEPGLHRSAPAEGTAARTSWPYVVSAKWTGRAGAVGCLELDQEHRAGFSADLPGTVAPATVDRAGVDILSPMDVPRTHFDPRTILRLDEPTARQRHHPLRPRTLMPLTDPAHGEDHEQDRRHLVRDLSQPQGRRLAADALHFEPAERAGRQTAGAVRPGPQAVVRHLRLAILVVSVAARGPERWQRHRHVSMVSDEMGMRAQRPLKAASRRRVDSLRSGARRNLNAGGRSGGVWRRPSTLAADAASALFENGRRRMTFTVRSNSFNDGDYLAKTHILSAAFGFGCEGDNQSPHLAWSGAPAGTKSFAVTCFDPDAPTGSGFWHWLVVNIPPSVTELALDAGNPQAPKLPSGTLQTRTDFGAPGYGGPCPPPGDHPHRYLFTVFAVGADKLQVGADTSAAVIGFQLHFNTLAKAAIMGLYKRGSA